MIFDRAHILTMLGEVDINLLQFILYNVGSDVLQPYEIEILKNAGVDIEKLGVEFTPWEQQFLFGRLAGLLGHGSTLKLTYKDVYDYIHKKQFIPLSPRERDTLEIAKRRSYSHIKGLGETIKSTVEGLAYEVDLKRRDKYEKVISDAVQRGLVYREGAADIMSEIGHKTGDWDRNLHRIAVTELNTVMQEGIAAEIEREHGADALVYKSVYEGACRHCIELYTTAGIGSKPIIFKLSELRANGTNIGKKVADWRGVVGSTHPYCRCRLNYLRDSLLWSAEQKRFVEGEYVSKYKNIAPIRVAVGSKVFEVK